MKTPLMKTALSMAMIFLMGACASDSGSGGSPSPAPVTNKLALKSTGSKTIFVGTSRDLRAYLVNADSAEFKVTRGQQLVKWTDAELPVMAFQKAGNVVVLVTDTVDQTRVELKFKVTFDSTGLGHGPDIEAPDVPIEVPNHL